MSARKTVIGLCMICALLVSAVAAQGAGAVEAKTCSNTAPSKTFATGTCGTGETGTAFGLQTFTGETAITGSAIGNTVLKATVGGAAVTLTSTSLEGKSATMKNNAGVVEGTGQILYKGVTANHGCTVAGGEILTRVLKAKATTASALKFEPETGTEFANFVLSGCEAGFTSLDHEWKVSGSVTGTPNGGMTEFTHTATTGQMTLFVEGNIKAGIEGTLVIKGPNGNNLVLQ